MARYEVVSRTERGTYHVISRCVRRAWLLAGREGGSEHRREWIRQRVQQLIRGFAVEVLGYCVMSNHYHLVLRVSPEQVETWSDREVAERWLAMFTPKHEPGPKELDATYKVTEADIQMILNDAGRLEMIRSRLGDLSWFMRALNEYIARRANHEDGCSGRFWEGRFRCQRLVDEGGILACLCYVDLNPIRAKKVQRIEDADFSSGQDRLRMLNSDNPFEPPSSWLVDLDGPDSPFAFVGLQEYMRILQWTCEQLYPPAEGSAAGHEVAGQQATAPDGLARLDVTPSCWCSHMRDYRSLYWRVVGRVESIRAWAHGLGKAWFKGCRSAEMAWNTE